MQQLFGGWAFARVLHKGSSYEPTELGIVFQLGIGRFKPFPVGMGLNSPQLPGQEVSATKVKGVYKGYRTILIPELSRPFAMAIKKLRRRSPQCGNELREMSAVRKPSIFYVQI